MYGTNSSLHYFLTLINALSVITGLIISVAVLSRVLGAGCEEGTCQSMLYITTTFFSSRRIETSIGFPVATERSLSNTIQTPNNYVDTGKDRSYRFGHYLECMYTARMADKICPPTLIFNDYANCVSNQSAALDVCASFPTSGGAGFYHWPTSEEYLGCLWNNPLFQNSESQRASKNVFRACIDKSLWPFFEIPQGIDTPIFMGSYNWALLLATGLIIMTSFGVYTCSWKEDGVVSKGEPGYMMRLGSFWSLTALVWNVIFFAMFTSIAFRNAGEFQKGGGLPTTSSTSYLTMGLFAVAVIYFLSVALQPFRRGFKAYYTGSGGVAKVVSVLSGSLFGTDDYESQQQMLSSQPLHPGLSATLPAVYNGKNSPSFTLSEEDVAKYYTPPMLATWADSYFVDVCFVMGMAGATGQLSTDQAWNLFTLTFSYRILNMIISRCMSDAFMNNIRLDQDVNDAKNGIVTRPHMFYSHKQEPDNARPAWGKRGKGKSGHNMDIHLNIKIIGLSTQLAALYLYVGLLCLVFSPNSALTDFGYFKGFFVTCFIIPEALRLLLHLFYQLMYDHSDDGVPWMLYNSAFFIWIWDYVFRIIYVCIVIFEASNSPGTFDFLKTQTNALMRDYVVSML